MHATQLPHIQPSLKIILASCCGICRRHLEVSSKGRLLIGPVPTPNQIQSSILDIVTNLTHLDMLALNLLLNCQKITTQIWKLKVNPHKNLTISQRFSNCLGQKKWKESSPGTATYHLFCCMTYKDVGNYCEGRCANVAISWVDFGPRKAATIMTQGSLSRNKNYRHVYIV